MVTFSIPGDDVVEATNGTPRPRPQLPFARRAYAAASPFGRSPSKRLGTPHASSTRNLLTTRDEGPSSSVNKSSIATARNIFRASAMTDCPPTSTAFSPTIPNSTMKKVFAPGATPEPSRVRRESIAHAAPRGMAAKASSKELFTMRIDSPPPELTGEVLTQKVPKEWNAKGSIYADQFLAHLCPPELDEEQRRQFFCILDLRRLKYAANEIFTQKDWKLNIINFAKEFEKSRSIILLRYGLYEFQNVKPSKDVLRRWRREHGLPEPEDDEGHVATPSRPAAQKKRKLSDDDAAATPATGRKRPAVEQQANKTEMADSTSTPTGSRNKRKASMSEEQQPNKLQKPTPSSAKSLFEKIANKPAASHPAGESAAVPKPGLFTANKPAASSNLARSVFTNLNPPGTQTTLNAGAGGGNIFGHLPDASSAKNSGVDADADAESESESEQDDGQDQEAGPSDEASIAAGGAGDAGSQIASSLFGKKPGQPANGLGAGLTSAPETRGSTPGRSLFDRVTKGNDGRPVRVEETADEADAEAEAEAEAETDVEAEPESRAEAEGESVQEKTPMADQTWNPAKTPIKFAPSTTKAPASLFGNSGTSNSIFAARATAPSNIFGAAKKDESSTRGTSSGATVDQAGMDGSESDKENESQSARKALFDAKTPSAGQPSFGSGLFGAKPSSSEAPKPVANMFGGSTTAATPKVDAKTAEASTTSSLFGQSVKPPEAAASSFLFGAKPAETNKSTLAGTPAATSSLFGGITSKAAPESKSASRLFGAKPPGTGSSLFGGGASAAGQQPLFGAGAASSTAAQSSAAKTDAPKPPIFGLGSTATTGAAAAPSMLASKPLLDAPKSPPATATGSGLFGSPMKQDDASPAKKTMLGTSKNGDAAPSFSFGGGSSQPAAPSTSLFGGPSATTQAGTPAGGISFGGASSNPGSASGSFTFNFGGGPSAGAAAAGTTTTTSAAGFNNPFATNASTSSAPSFSFGAASPAPSGTSSLFQFGGGGGSSTAATGTGGGSSFGANQGSSNSNAAPIFGGTSAAGTAPSFNFSAGGAAPQGTGSVFGSNQAGPVFNLQPPAGGSSTTGTNSPPNLGGGGSSLATTPAAGTPEPSGPALAADAAKDGGANSDEEGEKHEQISLADAAGDDEEELHGVRAKVLKFIPVSEEAAGDAAGDKAKSKSPWSTQGIGQLRLLKHRETKLVRLVLRAEPRGHVVLNRAVLPSMSYKADEKYVKLTTSNEKGNGLETWMIQVKTRELARDLAVAMEENKGSSR